MALTNQELAIRARNLASERSPAATNITIPHIVAMIPTAIEAWGREAIKDPEKKPNLTQTFNVPLVAGSLDLGPYIDGTIQKISLTDLRATTIYTTISGIRTPFTWVGSQAQLNSARYFASDSPAIFLEGNMLRTRNTDGSQTSLGTASINFDVVNYPTSAANLPGNLVGDFILFLATLAAKEKSVDGM